MISRHFINALEETINNQTTVLSSPPLTVETIDNHVYFYAEVDSDRSLALIQQLKQVDGNLRYERINRALPDAFPPVPIWLHINSYGGTIDAAFALVDTISSLATPVYTVVEGMAASAATLISMAGKRRYITPNSVMLVHEATTFFWGRGSDMKDEMKLMDDIKDLMVAFYVKHSDMPEVQVRDLLSRKDNWFTAAEAQVRGMVDEILIAP